MAIFSEDQFKATLGSPMKRLSSGAEPLFDFWHYFDAIPDDDFSGHRCVGDVTYVWEDPTCRFQHVLFNSQDVNDFMVLVLDVSTRSVTGHRLLNINALYGLGEA
jgi:hypothetical protein